MIFNDKKNIIVFLFLFFCCYGSVAFANQCLEIVDQASEALNQGDNARAKNLAAQGVTLCRKEALEQQKYIIDQYLDLPLWISKDTTLELYPQLPKTMNNGVPTKMGWVELNAIARAHFIQAQVFKNDAKERRALQMYKKIIKNFPDAYQQAYQGWFWKSAELAQDAILLMENDYNFGNYKADFLIKQAWQAYHEKRYKFAEVYARKVLALYDHEDLNFQKESAVARFLLGFIYKASDQIVQAQYEFNRVINDYPQVRYPNSKDALLYNDITSQARDQINLVYTPYDFGNYSSQTLVLKAWKARDEKDFDGVDLYARKCIDLWEGKARQMQTQLKGFAPLSFIPYYGALNDVGACYFILGLSYKTQGLNDEARDMFQTVINDYGYSQCWDLSGHYWKVAEASQGKLNDLNKRKIIRP